MTRNDIEIMAPAGSFECLTAAIQGGADSVYFGVGKLNMRSRSANNFMVDDLPAIVALCRSHGVKSYLTVNTVLYDEDMQAMHEVIDRAKNAGVTAIIASDQAAIMHAFGQGMEIHISTQINISNYGALKFYASFADVMVLARELNMDQVKAIHERIVADKLRGPRGQLVRLEMFAHGALCMAVSGKCYLSLHSNNASANRGGCLQNCRRSYLVTDKETGLQLEIDNEQIMSPKDLCTIGFMDKMIGAGVRVFKIEGRARSAEYVKTAVSCYSEAAQAIVDGDYSRERVEEWRARLSTVFNRGFWDGYYLGQTMGEWSDAYGNKATKQKVQLGKVTNYFNNLGVAELLVESGELRVGDDILIIGPTTGVVETKVEELRVDLKPVDRAVKGERCSLSVPEKVRRADKLYRMEDK